MWRNGESCRAHLSSVGGIFRTSTLKDPVISEAGRALLSAQLGALSDSQIGDLFRAARVEALDQKLDDGEGGTRTVTINAADNLGNTGDNFCTFEIHPTLESMLSNLNRALSEGAIKNDGIFRSFQAKLNASLAAMNRGQCGAAFNNLAALTNELQAQRGKGIDAVVADRFIAFAQVLIDTGAPGCPAHSAVGVGE